MKSIRRVVAAGLLVMPSFAAAQTVSIEVTNHQPDGGFSFSPVWFAFHDGTFDAFDSGAAASPGVEQLAELANAAALMSEFTASGANGAQGVIASNNAPPPFTPGETSAMMFDVGDGAVRRYFSYASMFVPSNDFFFGNDDPTGVEVFDAGGAFLGPVTIQVFGSHVWDAGTEIEDIMDGGAFVEGVDALGGSPEGGVVHPSFSTQENIDYYASLVGVQTPIGPITDPFTSGELLATITIVPEPASATGIALLGLALVRSRWRNGH